MINPVRILAMQTAKGIQWDGIPGGHAAMTQSLAAAFCAGMPRKWYLAARLKWCDDVGVFSELGNFIERELSWHAQGNRWKMTPYRMHRMAQMAMIEVARPREFKSDDERAKFVGLQRVRYLNVWQSRYEIAYRCVEDWASRAYGWIAGAQREEKQ